MLNEAVKLGVSTCFMNPGTTEMPFVSALRFERGLRGVLVLQEGVATGAADGYFRMSGVPALTLLHLGPGLANALAYAHDARRAGSGMINIVGEHASWHLANDPPLAMDIDALAGTVSHAVMRVTSPAGARVAMAEAVGLARGGRIATLIVSHDVQLAEEEGASSEAPARQCPLPAVLPQHTGQRPLLLLGGKALRAATLASAERLAATGWTVLVETFPARMDRGGGVFSPSRLAYFPEQAVAQLAGHDEVHLVDTREPVAFFGYDGTPGRLLPASATICHVIGDEAQLATYVEALTGAAEAPARHAPAAIERSGETALDALSFARAIAAAVPADAIVMDEGNTTSAHLYEHTSGSPSHAYLTQPGGAIGLGLPAATGAALACPDRPVLAIQADGSGLYTLQALWTQARERLNVTTVLCDNGAYRILGIELARAGRSPADLDETEAAMITLDNPRIDWGALARGFGIDHVVVETPAALEAAVRDGMATPGPLVIVAAIAG